MQSEVVIFRFEPNGGPGHFARFLHRHGIPYHVVKIDQNEPLPKSIDRATALVFMGGGMGASDDLDWIPGILELIRNARGRGVPMLGHCLGAQLISRALGGTVGRNPVAEIGWLPVDVIDNGDTPTWTTHLPATMQVFQWHNDTFSIPPGAVHLFTSSACPNQGFQLGNTLGLQFHIEILSEMIEDWSKPFARHEHPPGATVQSRETMQQDLDRKIAASNTIADRIYRCWFDGFH